MMKKWATFSDCRKYRYSLGRIWNDKKGLVCWVMLNPSTADENIEDPTIRRCMKFSEKWGYGGIVIGNLFAFRATDPSEMKAISNPSGGIRNDEAIERMSFAASITVCAWGNHGMHLNRANEVMPILTNPHFLKITSTKQPSHPLYMKGDLVPKRIIR